MQHSEIEKFKRLKNGISEIIAEDRFSLVPKLRLGNKKKFPLLILILILWGAALYYLATCFISQIYYHQGKNFFREKQYEMASDALKHAANYQPDDYVIQKKLGEVYFKLGELSLHITSAFSLAQKSDDCYQKAFQLNPIDAETAYSLARCEARLEQLYPYLYPEKKENPYKPLSYFETAVRLRPNGIQYNYALARYLHKQGEKKYLFEVISRLVRIYPSVYHHLKKENFWDDSARKACKKGLEDAVKRKNNSRDAHMILSAIQVEDKNLPAAISHYQKGLEHESFQNNAGNYIHLGSLFMINHQIEEAEICFFYAMNISRTIEKDLERIYFLYKKNVYSAKFCQFYQKLRRRFILSFRAEILLARALMDLKQYQEACQILNTLNERNPEAEIYYWLARIAEAEQNWDAMELAIQKATVLDPENSMYHRIFSNVLRRLKKFEQAEKQAKLAAQYR